MSIVRKIVFASAVLSALVSAPAAQAGSLFTLFDREDLLTKDYCDTNWVYSAIKARFDGHTRPNLGLDVSIIGFQNAKLRYSKPRDDEHLVGRQYCQAQVIMSDRKARTVWYLLEYPWGFAGTFTHVEFCIQGMDPWHVYGRACSTVR